MEDTDSAPPSGKHGASSPTALCVQAWLSLGNKNSLELSRVLKLAYGLPCPHPSSVPGPLHRASQSVSLSSLLPVR